MKLIGYIVSGYHTLEQSTEIARDYVESGCDMLEISLPLLKNQETPFLSSLMKEAYLACPNYEKHLAGIKSVAERFPKTSLTLLLYQEAALKIGARRLAQFCRECGIHDINSPDMTNTECISELRGAGVKLAGLILYDFDEESLRQARETDGFVYVQAFPFEGQQLHDGIEGPAELIRFIRSRGVTAPLYCGGGIHTPELARGILKAGGDGIFLGTPVLTLYDKPQDLRRVIRSFAEAVKEPVEFLGGYTMKFTPVYYICAACPTVEKTLEMVDAYVAHGATAFQIDMPSKNPFMETEFVKEMMKTCVTDGLDYERYMEAIREMRRRHPKVELHIVIYNDIVDSIGLDALCNFCREAGAASLMVPGITPENFASIEARGVKIFRFIEHEMLESQVEFAANKSGADDYICLRNLKPGERDKPGYDTWEKKYVYIRGHGVTGMVYSVYGIHTKEELARVKASGASGAIIGNVLMKLWDDKEALWKLFAEFQSTAEV